MTRAQFAWMLGVMICALAAQETTAQEVSRDGWHTWDDPDGYFQLRYPEDWKLYDIKNLIYFVPAGSDSDSLRTFAWASSRPAPPGVSARDWADRYVRFFPKEENVHVDAIEDAKLGPLSACRIISTRETKSGKIIKVQELVAVDHSRTYVVSMRSDPETFDKWAKIANAMAATFELTDPSPQARAARRKKMPAARRPGWAIWTDAIRGFRAQYPLSWQIVEQQGATLFMRSTPVADDPIPPTLRIDIQDAPGDRFLNDIVELYLHETAKNPEYRVGTVEDTVLGAFPAKRFIFTKIKGAGQAKTQVTIAIRESKLYLLYFMAKEKDFDENVKIADVMADSVEFLRTPTTQRASKVDTSAWATNEDEENHLRFSHPAEWKRSEGPFRAPMFTLPNTLNPLRAGITVSAIGNWIRPGEDTEGLPRIAIESIRKTEPDVREERPTESTLGRFGAKRILLTGTKAGVAFKWEVRWFEHAHRVYIMFLAGNADAVGQNEDVLQAVADSFDLIPDAPTVVTARPTSRPTAKSSRNGWITVQETDHHFQYQRPQDWIEKDWGAYKSFADPGSAERGYPIASVEVRTRYFGEGKKQPDKSQLYITWAKEIEDFKLELDGTAKLGGMDGDFVIYTSADGGRAVRTMVFSVERNGRMYTVRYRASREAFDQYVGIANAVADSFALADSVK